MEDFEHQQQGCLDCHRVLEDDDQASGKMRGSFQTYSPPSVDRMWGIWGSYYNIPEAIFDLLKGVYNQGVIMLG